MGQILSQPMTTISEEYDECDNLVYVSAAMQGWRRFMEDAQCIVLQKKNVNVNDEANSTTLPAQHYFALFDGHSGGEASKYCAQELHGILKKNMISSDTIEDKKKALTTSFLEMDVKMQSSAGQMALRALSELDDEHPELDCKAEAVARFLIERAQKKKQLEREDAPPPKVRRRRRSLTMDGDEALSVGRARVLKYDLPTEKEECAKQPKEEDTKKSSAGTTALVVLMHGNELLVANAGDCRCVLSRNGIAVDLSEDHKPELEREMVRIEAAGSRVHQGRIDGGLNLSRALGDFDFKKSFLCPEKQAVSPCPEFRTATIDHCTDEFMILACDGIWEVMSSQQVVDFVQQSLKQVTSNEHTFVFLQSILKNLFQYCMASQRKGHMETGIGLDNMSAILILFRNNST